MAISDLQVVPMPIQQAAITDDQGRLTTEGFNYLRQIETLVRSYNTLLAALRAASISGI